jgi:tetratricopeptide (TPR) repeat protein
MRRILLSVMVVACGAGIHAAERPWFAAEARSIRVLSNASASAAIRTLGDIALADAMFASLVNVTASRPIHAFAVKDAGSLRELAPQFWERRGIRPHAVAYAGPHSAFIAVREDLSPAARQEALLHEYAHLLTAAHAPDAPAWLDEGLAEFWGSVVLENDRVTIGRSLKKHMTRLQRWPPLQRTLKRQRGEFIADSEPAEDFYAQSWAMVHYLLLGRSEPGALRFLPDYRSLPEDWESALREYVGRGELREVTLPFTPPPPPASTPSFIPESRARAERARMLVFGPRPDAAAALATRALEPEPRDAVALEVMGTYYFLQNKAEDAREWLTRAFETKAASPAAALYLALLSPAVSDRERYLMAALQAKPDFEAAWQQLFSIYLEDGRLELLRRWVRQ